MSSSKINIRDKEFSTIVTIGTFDGVHLGHQKILKELLSKSKSLNLIPTVLTLFPHPRMVLNPNAPIKLLHTIDERVIALKKFGISNVVVKTFNKSFANLSPKDYVKSILVDELNIKAVVIGYDHRFGKNRSADIRSLRKFAQEFDFDVEEISAQDINEITISSTKIRNALHNGDVALANSFLGYQYSICGNVVKGEQLGRTIGFPTANIHIEEDYKLIPKDGVYIVQSKFLEKRIFGMMNIGSKPTLGKNHRSIEVHFFNFKEDLYETSLNVEFLSRLRDEEKFQSLTMLQKQLERDKISALNYISNLK